MRASSLANKCPEAENNSAGYMAIDPPNSDAPNGSAAHELLHMYVSGDNVDQDAIEKVSEKWGVEYDDASRLFYSGCNFIKEVLNVRYPMVYEQFSEGLLEGGNDSFQVTGHPDLIREYSFDPSSLIAVVDYKQTFSVQMWEQHKAYAYMYGIRMKSPPDIIHLYIVNLQSSESHANELTWEELDEWFNVELVERYKSSTYRPSILNCKYCHYKLNCAAYGSWNRGLIEALSIGSDGKPNGTYDDLDELNEYFKHIKKYLEECKSAQKRQLEDAPYQGKKLAQKAHGEEIDFNVLVKMCKELDIDIREMIPQKYAKGTVIKKAKKLTGNKQIFKEIDSFDSTQKFRTVVEDSDEA